ncbi:hypothetical protein [Streptomyces sp. NPDC014623]|uniref:hypothetical protein n=1 Tax=Streptomyces sp. NPDC014623 TaxID=3364875 RepID=UPI003700EB3A
MSEQLGSGDAPLALYAWSLKWLGPRRLLVLLLSGVRTLPICDAQRVNLCGLQLLGEAPQAVTVTEGKPCTRLAR